MLQPYAITIARGYGSGGLTIGKMLAQRLAIPYYDREILKLASDESGIHEQLFAQADEKVKNSLLLRVAKDAYKGEVIEPDSDDFISNENLFRYQAKVIRALAQEGPAVFIGRCADYILKDFDNVARIYVHAPFEDCVRNVMEIKKVSRQEAEHRIRRIDKRRAAYYRTFTGQDWKDADHYDLCLNSSLLGFEKCVDIVKAYLEIRFSL